MDPEISRAIAKLTVLEHLVRTLMFDHAMQAGKTATDLAKYADDLSAFFIERTKGDAEAYLTGAVDAFFKPLIDDLRDAGSL